MTGFWQVSTKSVPITAETPTKAPTTDSVTHCCKQKPYVMLSKPGRVVSVQVIDYSKSKE